MNIVYVLQLKNRLHKKTGFSHFSNYINYFAAYNLLTAKVNLDFFLAAVFLCKTPLLTALSHN